MPPTQKDLAVIIVHYHTPKLLSSAIESLNREFKNSKLNAEIIVVDNGSSESDSELLESLPAKYVKSERNLGYGAGINRGAVYTVAENMIFMNPDVLVQPGCLAALIRELRAGADAAGPKLFWDEELSYILPPTEKHNRLNRFFRAAATWGTLPCRLVRGLWRRHAHRHWNAKKPFRSFELSGALLAVTREAWNKIGPMDESFKLYFEENDWLMRLKRAALTARYVPDAHAYHVYNQSGRDESQVGQWFAESQQLFEQRYYGDKFCRFISKITRRQPVIDDNFAPPADRIPELKLSSVNTFFSRPKWFEFSILPFGFPATGCRVAKNQSSDKWRVPDYLYQQLSVGNWEIRVVCSGGKEALSRRFSKKV